MINFNRRAQIFICSLFFFSAVPNVNAQDCYVQKISIARHIDVNFTADQADAKLQHASKLLKDKYSATDYSCCVIFERDGAIGVFGKSGDNLDKPSDLSSVRNVFHKSRHNIKVVNRIESQSFWEAFIGTNSVADLSGIAYPGLTLIVEQASHAAVWAHEYGHYKHLWVHSDNPKNLMYHIASEKAEVDKKQCLALQEGGVKK